MRGVSEGIEDKQSMFIYINQYSERQASQYTIKLSSMLSDNNFSWISTYLGDK